MQTPFPAHCEVERHRSQRCHTSLRLGAVVSCPRNSRYIAGGQLAVFQGASEAPISESYGSSEQRGKTANCAEVQNQYPRVVKREGNRIAQELVNKVFDVCDRKWRGVGSIPKSGYKLRYEFRDHDAERLFEVEEIDTQEPSVCISGLVLKGVKKPHDCPAFGKECTPHHPLGATMVSAEGACAAYYAYGRHLDLQKRVGKGVAVGEL